MHLWVFSFRLQCSVSVRAPALWLYVWRTFHQLKYLDSPFHFPSRSSLSTEEDAHTSAGAGRLLACGFWDFWFKSPLFCQCSVVQSLLRSAFAAAGGAKGRAEARALGFILLFLLLGFPSVHLLLSPLHCSFPRGAHPLPRRLLPFPSCLWRPVPTVKPLPSGQCSGPSSSVFLHFRCAFSFFGYF